TIGTLQYAVEKARMGVTDKAEALKKLHEIAVRSEKDFIPNDDFDKLVQKERDDSWKYGGKTVFGNAKRPRGAGGEQLKLF
ncbi:MAG TPA: hypothetical protein VJU78_08980, partial [Chitinophagaceae bacterium]|nr:hypothetical protein [Chitinophagaceae bacterium]